MTIGVQVPLHFAPDAVRTQTHVNLSAVCADGPWLWIADDEAATVERLTGDGTRYGEHVSFRLADAVELPGKVFEVPHGEGDDHAEGITLLDGTPPRLLVVYDSPASWRLPETGTVLADVVPLH